MYAFIALGMVVASVVVAAVTGFTRSSIVALLLAMAACVPAAYGFWLGMQEETQKKSALNLLALLLAGMVALVLLVLKLVGWVRLSA